MSAARIEWHGDRVIDAARRNAERRIGVAAQLVANQVKRNISQAYPPASSGGEYPHLRAGQLRNSVFWRMEATENPEAIVGVTALHGLFLSEGTANMEARPFLEPTLEEMRGEIERIVAGGGGV